MGRTRTHQDAPELWLPDAPAATLQAAPCFSELASVVPGHVLFQGTCSSRIRVIPSHVPAAVGTVQIGTWPGARHPVTPLGARRVRARGLESLEYSQVMPGPARHHNCPICMQWPTLSRACVTVQGEQGETQHCRTVYGSLFFLCEAQPTAGYLRNGGLCSTVRRVPHSGNVVGNAVELSRLLSTRRRWQGSRSRRRVGQPSGRSMHAQLS